MAEPTPPTEQPAAAKAARARKDAFENVKAEDRNMVDALLIERQGYVQRGTNTRDEDLKERMADRVRQVDEQLRLRGCRV